MSIDLFDRGMGTVADNYDGVIVLLSAVVLLWALDLLSYALGLILVVGALYFGLVDRRGKTLARLAGKNPGDNHE